MVVNDNNLLRKLIGSNINYASFMIVTTTSTTHTTFSGLMPVATPSQTTVVNVVVIIMKNDAKCDFLRN